MQRLVFIAVALVAILGIGGVFILGKLAQPPAPAAEETPAIENPTPTLRAHAVLGPESAPVTVVEFSNYGCPHCRDHALKVLPLLVRDYLDPGRIRYVFRTLPFPNQPQVFAASVAATCAYDLSRERFLDYHMLLFRAAPEWLSLSGDELADKLADYARQLGISAAELRACLESPEAEERVRFDQALANALGVTGTPTFFVNGEKYEGFMPYERWREILGE